MKSKTVSEVRVDTKGRALSKISSRVSVRTKPSVGKKLVANGSAFRRGRLGGWSVRRVALVCCRLQVAQPRNLALEFQSQITQLRRSAAEVRSRVAQLCRPAMKLGVKEGELSQIKREFFSHGQKNLIPGKSETNLGSANRSNESGKSLLWSRKPYFSSKMLVHGNENARGEFGGGFAFARSATRVASKLVSRGGAASLKNRLDCRDEEKSIKSQAEEGEKQEKLPDNLVGKRLGGAEHEGKSRSFLNSIKKPFAACAERVRGAFGNRRMDFEVDATGRRVPGEITLGNIDNVELVNDPGLSHEFVAEIKKLNEEQMLERFIDKSLLEGEGVLSEGEEDESILSESESVPDQTEAVSPLSPKLVQPRSARKESYDDIQWGEVGRGL